MAAAAGERARLAEIEKAGRSSTRLTVEDLPRRQIKPSSNLGMVPKGLVRWLYPSCFRAVQVGA